jgi:ABC-type multidrug transport system fused ATPase/permease subunit
VTTTAGARPSTRSLIAATVRRPAAVARLAGWTLLGALPTFAGGLAIARAVDEGFLAGRPAVGFAWLAALAVTVPLGALGARRMYLDVARLAEPLRDDLVALVVEGALRGSTRTGAERDTGAVARLTQHVEVVREMVAGLLLLVLGFAGAVVAALAGLVTVAPAVLPLVLVPLGLAAVAFAATLSVAVRRQERLLLADERLASLATDAVEGLRDIVACGAEDVMAADLDGRVDEQVAARRAVAGATALRTAAVALGAKVPVILVLLGTPWLLGRGLTAGALLGTLTYLVQGLDPAVSSLASGVGAPLAQLLVTARRIDEAAADAGAEDDAADLIPDGRWTRPPAPHLALRAVTFRYRDDAEPVVDRLDLDVPEGDHLVIVGPSGAGKSTLAALLVGVLRPQSGVILHGDRPPHAVDAAERVLIPQQAYVFRGTLEENLRYLADDAPQAALDRSVTAVGLAPLRDRIGGYGATLEPATLSAGERQLIALARAHLSPARLVVLDEATSHLDPTAEAVAETAFAERDGTLVVVAHRISSAQRGRRILVMDGRLVTVGTHDDLTVRSPLYRELVGHWRGDGAPASGNGSGARQTRG